MGRIKYLYIEGGGGGVAEETGVNLIFLLLHLSPCFYFNFEEYVCFTFT